MFKKNKSYSPWETWVYGYYVAGPGELLDSALYPWGWEEIEYDDSDWTNAQQSLPGSVKGGADYPGRLLVPTPILPMEYRKEPFRKIREVSGMPFPEQVPTAGHPLIIPAHSQVRIVLDQEKLTTAYLCMATCNGKDAEISIGYTEAYYTDLQTGAKGNRQDIKEKTFVGYEDKIIADGGTDRVFTSLWWRTWRYVDIRIETKGEPLVVDDLYGIYSVYPFIKESDFHCPENKELEEILEIGWRTARLCANETYMDCPYYEQLQYFGDTRIQALITLYNTRDDRMVKNAIEQGRQSLSADGLTMGRYPTHSHQYISSFSLWWIGMGYDYWMYRGDEQYLKTLLPAYRTIIAWYEQWLKPDHSLGYVPYWFFADWADEFPNGEPIRDKEGNSAFQDLLFILALQYVSEMEEAFGLPAMATHYRSLSEGVINSFRSKYWNEKRELFADTYDHRSYSQHVNSLAVLTGVTSGEEARNIMQKILMEKDVIQGTIYFRYYIHQALGKAGLGEKLLNNLQIWKEQMALGLTTWAERPEPSRSDCHAWGASPNIEFYRTLLGIDTATPGFRKVKISPALGTLKSVSGSVPHPLGIISVAYTTNNKGVVTATIDLPPTLTGSFYWKGQEYSLQEGKQTLHLHK